MESAPVNGETHINDVGRWHGVGDGMGDGMGGRRTSAGRSA